MKRYKWCVNSTWNYLQHVTNIQYCKWNRTILRYDYRRRHLVSKQVFGQSRVITALKRPAAAIGIIRTVAAEGRHWQTEDFASTLLFTWIKSF